MVVCVSRRCVKTTMRQFCGFSLRNCSISAAKPLSLALVGIALTIILTP